ncbi:MAG: HAD hydrolase-like protein [Ferruginibacter sp.]|nr:HAD hydrolase-like protein [Ferruginibacter sp.]
MKPALVVFDIAGTTVTDNNNVNDAFSGAFEKAGYPVATRDVNHIMGYRKIEAIKILLERFYPKQLNNEQLIREIHNRFTEDMQAFYLHTPLLQALPYAEEIFRLLHTNNIKVALDTGFTKIITDTIMQRLGWEKNGLADLIISSDEVEKGRPYPYMIRSIMDQLKIAEVKQVVKIGDTEVDIEEGRNAGCGLVISVTTGSYSREELEKFSPDHIIGSLGELPAILNLTS